VEAFLESLGTPGPALAAVAGFVGLAWLLGQLVARGAGSDANERSFLALVAGFDLLALLVLVLVAGLDLLPHLFLVLGWSGFFVRFPWHGATFAALAVALVLLGRLLARRLARGPRPSVPWHALPLVLVAVVLATVALAYPFSWDDLVYQLEVPLRWRATGGLPVFADNPYSGFPGAFALLNLALVESGGILAPGLFNAVLWLVLALRLAALLTPRIGRAGATALTLSFALSWPVLMEALSSYAELFLVLHLLAVMPLLLRSLAEGRAPSPREQLLLGLASGTALAIKLTGAVVPVLAAGLLLLGAWRRSRRGGRTERARLVLFLMPLLLVALAFYARPALLTGNPLHPYFAAAFVEDEAALATSAYHHAAGTARFGVPLEPSTGTLGYFLAAPVLLALGPLGDLGRFDGQFGLQFLGLFALLGWLLSAHLRGRERVGEPWTWLAAAALLYAAWFVTSQQTRFLFPAAVLLVVAASFGWTSAPAALRTALTALLPLLALSSIPGRTYQHLWIGLGVCTGRVSALEYVDSANPDRYLAACQAILERTPPEARVLLLFEHRGLYVPRAHALGTPFFQARFFTPSERVTSPAELLATLQREGFTHVLVGYNVNDPDRMEAYLERTRAFQQHLIALRGRGLEILWESRENATGEVRHGLYRVRPPG
jgi:hypothetical protein